MNFLNKILFFLSVLLFSGSVYATTDAETFFLKDRILSAEEGDFVVYKESKNFSILRVHSVKEDRLVIEEINVPDGLIKKDFSYRKWVESGAPGSTSWTLYEISKEDLRLLSAYSYSQRSWLHTSGINAFFTRLLALSFKTVPQNERKKIGPSPLPGESDNRAIWNPSVIHDGKVINDKNVLVWRGIWPKDSSILSQSIIEIYLSKESIFPCWVEIKSGHYSVKIMAVDCGKSMGSPVKIPPRLPAIG